MKKMMFLVGMTGMVGIVELRSPNPDSSQVEEIKNLKQKITTLESKVNELSKKVEKQGSGSSKGGSPALKPMRDLCMIERKSGYLVGRDYSGNEFLDLTPEEIKEWKTRFTLSLIEQECDAEEIQEMFDDIGI